MKVIPCANKRCGFRRPMNHMLYRDGNYWCSDKCLRGGNPPENDKTQASQALMRPQIRMPYDHPGLMA